MGDERELRYELLDAARGRSPRTREWEEAQGSEAYFSGQGSQNIWLMRFATQVLRGRVDLPLARAVYTYQLGPAVGGITPAYGGSEFLSTIYWTWHVMSHAALMRAKDAEIAALAERWLVLNWVLFRAITAPDGSLMLFGQRSAGHVPFPREMDWAYALASGGDLRRAEKWCKTMGAGLRDSWEKEIALELQPELKATWWEATAIPIEELQAVLPLRVPTEIVRTSQGIAVVHAANCNPNTPPILAGTSDLAGRRVICPTSTGRKGEQIPGGVRLRQRFDHASARIDGAEIVYRSSLYTEGQEVRIPMPGGEVLYHLKLGQGAQEVPVDAGAGDPVEPLPSLPPDTLRAADLLEGLQLPRREQGRQAAIVLALRKGDDPAIFLPVIKAWFREDSPQVQAAQWREALGILERTG